VGRFNKGWVPIPRDIHNTDPNENVFFGDGACRAILVNIIAWAARFDTALVKQGQLLTSVEELQAASGFGRHVVRRCIEKLVNHHWVGHQATNRGCIITVLNYKEKYIDRPTDGQHSGQQAAISRPTDGQQAAISRPHNRQSNNATLQQENNVTIGGEGELEVGCAVLEQTAPVGPAPAKRKRTAKQDHPKKAPSEPAVASGRWAAALGPLVALDAVQAVFELARWERHFDQCLTTYGLNCRDIEQLAFRMSVWAAKPGTRKIKDPYSTFATFCSRLADDRGPGTGAAPERVVAHAAKLNPSLGEKWQKDYKSGGPLDGIMD
jgi:hypothetical protein